MSARGSPQIQAQLRRDCMSASQRESVSNPTTPVWKSFVCSPTVAWLSTCLWARPDLTSTFAPPPFLSLSLWIWVVTIAEAFCPLPCTPRTVDYVGKRCTERSVDFPLCCLGQWIRSCTQYSSCSAYLFRRDPEYAVSTFTVQPELLCTGVEVPFVCTAQ